MNNIDLDNYNIDDHYQGRYKEKYQFMMIGYNLITDEKMSKANIRLYFWLRRYVRKIKTDGDILDIFGKYYMRGYLGASWTINELAKRLRVSNSTIKRWSRELVKDKAMFVRKEKNPINGRPQNVYVLGEIDEKQEVYYYEGSKMTPYEGS